MPITRLLLVVGVGLLFEEPILVDRLTTGLELVLLPYEKLLLGATGRGILDFFAEALGGLTFVEASSKLFDVFANNAAFPLRLDKIEVTVG